LALVSFMSNGRRFRHGLIAFSFVGGGVELLAAYVGGRVDDLALQVGVIDNVEIDDASVPTPAAVR